MLQRSPRVKAIDFHVQNPWIIFGLYSGTLGLYDYSTNSCIRTIQASVFPVRAVRFITQNQWIICGSDDFYLRIFNYNTMQKIKYFQGHDDFIRGLIVHPSQPYVISCSDDAKIKIWNYQKDFKLITSLQQHKNFIMSIALNPRDLTKFASGSMDKTIKLWNITSDGKANMTLSGHKSCVNCLDFYKGDRPHIASGSDDRTIKIWDYQTKQCLNTLTSYSLTISSVIFHSQLPILISTGQEGKVIIHHTNTYTILNTLQYNLGMGWVTDISKQNSNIIGIGFDEGSVVVRIGSDEPVVSLSNGKILWTKSMQVYTTNLKAINLQQNKSGQKINIFSKQLGHADIYPSYIRHSSNGHYFALCNQTLFVVIKTASFKSVVLSNGCSLVWCTDSDFAVLQNDVINLYNNFQYSSSIKLPFIPKKICQGYLLSVIGNNSILLYSWEHIQKPLHNLQIPVQKIWWNQNAQLVAMATSDKLYIYNFNKKNWSLTQLMIISTKVTSGVFCGRVFIYMNNNAKIYFSLYGKNFFLQNYQKKKFILGIVQQQNRLYLFDKNNSIYSLHIPFYLFHKITQYLSTKGTQLPQIPQQLKNTIAKVLHQFGFVKEAYKIVQNSDHKFQLAIQLGLTRQAYKIAMTVHSIHKIKLIGDISLKKGQIQMAIECYKQIQDLNSLLMIYSSLSLPDQLAQLGRKAEQVTKMNVAYMCYYLTNQPNKCVDVLIKSKKYSQAALFSRTYCPNRISQCVKLWKQSIPDKMIANKISDMDEQQSEEEEEEEEGEDSSQKQQQQQQKDKLF